ncbi:alpha/beta hydrolase [Halobaculum sp. MBLA0147]|uniref:alpha/beta hydrolase n=1 Tax=Halobaculum sp. MBLA0147 TaxID=3079934 RepID=UPI003524B38C
MTDESDDETTTDESRDETTTDESRDETSSYPDLDPAFADAVAEIEALGVPPWHELAVESARRVEDELFSTDAHLPVAQTTELGFDGPDGAVPVRVYRPAETPAPTLVFFHGGGWCLGTLDSADGICRRLCRRLDAVVVSVDYRLAPENPFPAAVEDAVAAVRWVARNAAALGGDGHVGVAGTSAGGNLAAATALAAAADDSGVDGIDGSRVDGADTSETDGADAAGAAATAHGVSSAVAQEPLALDVDLAVQALFYPMVSPWTDTPSHRERADGPLLTSRDVTAFWETYLQSPVHRANPYAVPALADAGWLAATPPAVVAVGDHDPLRDDATRYADCLREAGVSVDEHVFDGLPHGFCSFADDASDGQTGVPAADRAFDAVVEHVTAQFAAVDGE